MCVNCMCLLIDFNRFYIKWYWNLILFHIKCILKYTHISLSNIFNYILIILMLRGVSLPLLSCATFRRNFTTFTTNLINLHQVSMKYIEFSWNIIQIYWVYWEERPLGLPIALPIGPSASSRPLGPYSALSGPYTAAFLVSYPAPIRPPAVYHFLIQPAAYQSMRSSWRDGWVVNWNKWTRLEANTQDGGVHPYPTAGKLNWTQTD